MICYQLMKLYLVTAWFLNYQLHICATETYQRLVLNEEISYEYNECFDFLKEHDEYFNIFN